MAPRITGDPQISFVRSSQRWSVAPPLLWWRGILTLFAPLMTRVRIMWTSLGCACSTTGLLTLPYARSLVLGRGIRGLTTRLTRSAVFSIGS